MNKLISTALFLIQFTLIGILMISKPDCTKDMNVNIVTNNILHTDDIPKCEVQVSGDYLYLKSDIGTDRVDKIDVTSIIDNKDSNVVKYSVSGVYKFCNIDLSSKALLVSWWYS